MELLYSGALLSSPIWWSQIADSHCLCWKAAGCILPACGPVYYAALSLAWTKTAHWSKHWPSRSHLTTNPATSLHQTLFHLSYAYPESARGCGSDVILKVFFRISMSLLSNCAQSTQRDICLLRSCPVVQKVALRWVGSEISQKEPFKSLYLIPEEVREKNQLRQTYIYIKCHALIFYSVQVLVKYITLESVKADLCYYLCESEP